VNRTRRLERLEIMLLTDARDAAGPSALERLTAKLDRMAARMAESGELVDVDVSPEELEADIKRLLASRRA